MNNQLANFKAAPSLLKSSDIKKLNMSRHVEAERAINNLSYLVHELEAEFAYNEDDVKEMLEVGINIIPEHVTVEEIMEVLKSAPEHKLSEASWEQVGLQLSEWIEQN